MKQLRKIPGASRWIALIAIVGIVVIVGLGIATLMLIDPSGGQAAFNGTVLDPPQDALDFALQNQREQAFRLSDARAKVVVLTFLYTSCTDVCPFIGVKLRRAIDLLGEDADDVVFVAVSMDPERDTPGRIAEYSRELDMYDRWHYLIGTEEQLRPVWQAYYVGTPVITDESVFASDADLRLYGLLRGLDGPSVAAANRTRSKFGGGYDVGHPTPVWLIDSEQQIRVKLGQDLDPSELAQDIRLLIRETAG